MKGDKNSAAFSLSRCLNLLPQLQKFVLKTYAALCKERTVKFGFGEVITMAKTLKNFI
jgi:hypothetical protein